MFHPEVAGHPGTVPQGHEDVVVDLLSRPPGLQFRVRHRGRPKSCTAWSIRWVRGQTARRRLVRRRGRLPCLGDVGGPPLKAGLKPGHRAEDSAVQQPADREEVAVPAPVLEYREHPAQPRGEVDEFLPLGAAYGEGLVDDDVEAGLQCGFRERIVGGRRRAEHQQVQLAGELQDVGRGVDDPGRGVAGRGGGLPAGIGRGDGIQRIGRVCGDEGGMEDAAREAEAGDGGADGPG